MLIVKEVSYLVGGTTVVYVSVVVVVSVVVTQEPVPYFIGGR